MSQEIDQRVQVLGNFTTLQAINAMTAHLLSPIGTREKIIYFIFVENAAFECLSDVASEKEIESFVLDQIFGAGGIHEDIGVTMTEKKVAYGLLAKQDENAIRISKASTKALQSFVNGAGESTRATLAGLINDKTLLPGV
jgi:hypothetical protein